MSMSIPRKDKRTRLINFKVNDEEYDKILNLAGQHAGGNLSLWLRYRGMSLNELNLQEDDDDDDTNSD